VKSKISKSFNDTINLGRELARILKGGSVVLLDGEMGAGKSVFAKGIARAFSVRGDVLSPTFSIMNNYQVEIDGRNLELCHIDAYRIKSTDEALGAGLGDVIGDSSTICLIEWFDNIKELINKNHSILVTIKRISKQSERMIDINL